ncbi:unnamed protein product [Pleuronectes platessa]|uniref:Uncharacterized protein n=1 Tax=Pleuronectes platessa TaxID=8262 RepID=A0A9N7V5S1_PLEPL|nr:unnamed protein product [Pleuronectes platessa]
MTQILLLQEHNTWSPTPPDPLPPEFGRTTVQGARPPTCGPSSRRTRKKFWPPEEMFLALIVLWAGSILVIYPPLLTFSSHVFPASIVLLLFLVTCQLFTTSVSSSLDQRPAVPSAHLPRPRPQIHCAENVIEDVRIFMFYKANSFS